MTEDMLLRTSASHPITLSGIFDWQGGSLGLCFCPGKCVNRDGVRHKRNLQQDLKHLQGRYGITGLVCLLNAAELRYATSVEKAGLVLLSFPIIEMAAPTCIHQTHCIVHQTAQLMADGHHIAVHCRGSVGRAGLIAACLLLYTQQAATGQEAMTMVRRRRCKSAIETARQEEFVCKYARLCQHEQALKLNASSNCTAGAGITY
ncbi:hypothetical protein WJX79_009242 [Trebouxia sp. C0005]